MPAEPPPRRTTLVLFSVVLLDLIAFGIVMPILPSYGARYGASDALVGVLVSSTPAMQLLFAPLWGRWSDRVGRRPVLLLSLAGSALSYVLFAAAGSFAALLLSRIAAGALDATVNVSQAFLADRTRPEERARAMGFIGAAFGLGFIIGPAVAGIASLFGDRLPGIIAAGITCANVVIAWRVLPGAPAVQRAPAPAAAPVASAAGSPAERYLPLAVAFLSTLGFSVLYVLLALFAERSLGYDRPKVSGLFVVLGVVTAIVQGGLVGRIARRLGERRLMLVGGVALALGLGALTAATHPGLGAAGAAALLVVAMTVIGTGWGLVGPGAAGYVSRHTDAQTQGKALGVLHGVGGFARVVGPLLFGVLAGSGGFVPPFCVAAGAALLAAAAGWSAPGERRGAGA